MSVHRLNRVTVAECQRVLSRIGEPFDRCRGFAAAIRINTLYMVMRAGSGHLGSSFSACDIVCWLLLEEMRDPFKDEGDVYLSSKGHDVPSWYAALIGLGYLDECLIDRLRRIGGLPGHPDVRTPYVRANTGSLGMGISKAKGIVLGDRLRGVHRRVYVLTGDGELQEGQNWEALAGARHQAMGELTMIVDRNKLQSDNWISSVSDLGDLAGRFESYGWGVLHCDGNDPSSLAAALDERAKSYSTLPAVVIADTVKGAGCPTFEATSMAPGEHYYRFHSGAPNLADYLSAHRELVASADELLARHGQSPLRTVDSAPVGTPRPASEERLVPAYGELLVERAQLDERIVALDSDLVVDTGLVPFSRAFPDRFFECGIAEQDMVSVAGGLAAGGILPFVHSFSCFLHARANEQLYNNATEGRRIVYVGSLAGLVPAGPGHSHQAVRDVSAVGAIPDLVVLEPANVSELRAAMGVCLQIRESVYLRLAAVPVTAEVAALPGTPLVIGQGRLVRVGGPCIAIGSGPVVLAQLLAAAEVLRGTGVDLTVINLPWLNRVDEDWLLDLIHDCDVLVVVENHYTRGGQADTIARALLELRVSGLPRFCGIGLTGVPACGTADEALAAHGLAAEQLAARIDAEFRGDGLRTRLDVRLSTE